MPAMPPVGSLMRRRLDLALGLCDTADGISLRHFRTDLHVDVKPDHTFVTEADRAIEELARREIISAFPDDGLVGEEYGEQPALSGVRWYIDPIDGTHNYLRGIPIFATLIAVEAGSDIELGVVSAPALGSRWFAWRGGGAWTIDQRGDRRKHRQLRVSGISRIEEAQLVYSSPVDNEQSPELPGFRTTIERAWRDRGFGDFWGYVLVAEGAAEAMVEVGMHSWDLAPMRVLLEEAGGRLTDLSGEPTIHGSGAIASNGALHDELVRALHEPPAR
jgi:histidinol-phosphatase